jgi:hypothetical protein
MMQDVQTAGTAGRGALWRGSCIVAEHRLRDMWKWKRSIIADSVGNPVLDLTAIGLGVWRAREREHGGRTRWTGSRTSSSWPQR